MDNMKLGITGSRNLTQFDFTGYFRLRRKVFKSFINSFNNGGIEEIVTGGAKGIDSLAETAAANLSIPLLTVYPDFEQYHGRLRFAAFLDRDEKIVRLTNGLLAVWNGDLSSHGTLYTMNAAIEDSKPVFLITVRDGKVVREGVQTEIIDYPGRRRWKK